MIWWKSDHSAANCPRVRPIQLTSAPGRGCECRFMKPPRKRWTFGKTIASTSLAPTRTKMRSGLVATTAGTRCRASYAKSPPTPRFLKTSRAFCGRRESSSIQPKAWPCPAVLLDPRHATTFVARIGVTPCPFGRALSSLSFHQPASRPRPAAFVFDWCDSFSKSRLPGADRGVSVTTEVGLEAITKSATGRARDTLYLLAAANIADLSSRLVATASRRRPGGSCDNRRRRSESLQTESGPGRPRFRPRP
jgi:hypothetical protein